MKITTEKPKELLDVIRAINDIKNEVTLSFDKDGLRVQTTDPTMVMMIDLSYSTKNFTEYQLDKDTQISVNLDTLRDILKRAKNTDVLSLSQEDNQLLVDIVGKSKRCFKTPLIVIDDEETNIPNLTFKANVELDKNLFEENIKDCRLITDVATVEMDNEMVTLKSDDCGSQVNTEINIDAGTKEQTEMVKSKFALEYLSRAFKFAKHTTKVRLEMSDDYPIRFSFDTEHFKLNYVIAPRVDDD